MGAGFEENSAPYTEGAGAASKAPQFGERPSPAKAQEAKEDEMEIGMVGLGRMGSNMVRRLLGAGHECVVFDVHPQAAQDLVKAGATATRSLAELVGKLGQPRAIWIMVPAAVVESTLGELVPLLAADDAVIDGGNSYYHDDIRRAETLGKSGIHYVDAGTSGGVWGFERGYCLMIGGEPDIVKEARRGLRRAGARSRRAGPRRGPGGQRHRSARLHPLRTVGRRALRQDGSQRDRVRRHGRVRRGTQHSSPRQRWELRSGRPTPRPRRSGTPSSTGTS